MENGRRSEGWAEKHEPSRDPIRRPFHKVTEHIWAGGRSILDLSNGNWAELPGVSAGAQVEKQPLTRIMNVWTFHPHHRPLKVDPPNTNPLRLNLWSMEMTSVGIRVAPD